MQVFSKLTALLCLLLNLQFAIAQSFYDLNTIQTIEITFTQSNWDALMDAEKAGAENYIMAQSVSINGQVFDSVGVKYKGNSTYSANQTKNPLHIELDTYKDHIYESYTDIKLSNVKNDPSFLREVLSYQVLRQYMDAPLSNYANVYINGNLMGLYSNSESISKKFVNSRFGSKSNTFVKCNPVNGAGPGATDLPDLTYQGTDSSNYDLAYELKSDYGWEELIDLIDTLNNSSASLSHILDIDRALWMLAYNNVLVNLDSYSGGFAQNYYLYRHDNGLFVPIVWDLNESFGRFSMTGSGNLNNTTSKQQMSYLLHSNDADHPLIQQLLSDPMYKRMYLAHMKTMINENFADGSYKTTAQSLITLIDASVQADPNKFDSYNNFVSNFNSDINAGRSSTPGITNLMDGRSTYLLAQSDFTATEPSIANIQLSNVEPDLGEVITISASIANETSVYLGYRSSHSEAFTRIAMNDAGSNGDVTANDGVYSCQINIASYGMEYYIYAENGTIGKFSPERAEYEFHSINSSPGLVINELMASNDGSYQAPNGQYPDWIELYNNGTDTLDLSAYRLSDDAGAADMWQLPNEMLYPGDYKIIWAAGDSSLGDDYADFKISREGEELVLALDNNGVLHEVDYISFDAQTISYSYGRESDGAEDWVVFKVPTPNAMNQVVSSVEAVENEFDVAIYPNPFQGNFNIENQNDEDLRYSVYNLSGSLIETGLVGAGQKIQVYDEMPSGVRIVHLQMNGQTKVEKLVSY